MTEQNQKQLGNTLWSIADQLRGAMDADDFRDYMLSFLFLRYLSDNYETAAKKELGRDYPDVDGDARKVPLALWYANNVDDIPAFEKQMRRKVHYVIQPAADAILTICPCFVCIMSPKNSLVICISALLLMPMVLSISSCV